ncbi:L-ascorbate oxidase-like protein [Hordeum vulgare]|nr:L-ascorbate oxidase-like protein [Hordeum vulgare]
MHLPRPFARAMEVAKPPVLWLRAYGCSHETMQVHVEYPKCRSMLLGRGWKAFARAHSLEDGHVLRFKLAEDDMLSVKFYGRSGVRLGCCKESSSGAECPSSSDNNEEDSGGSGALGGLGSRGVKSEHSTPSSN